MKVTAFLLLVFCIHVSASSLGQTKVSLAMKSTFGEVVEKLEKETEYRFVIKSNEPILSKEVEVTFVNEGMDKVLEELLEGTGYNYKIIDRYIAITSDDENVLQQSSVNGKVTDRNGEPLPGVTVVVKGTTQGTVTDVDGHYTLTSISENAVLLFSFVGMETQEVEVGNQTSINIVLQTNAVGIDEVIAIGYGTTTKRTTTAAVTKINTDNLQNLPVTSIGEALAGRAAGLIVTNNGGGIGKRPTITVRGGGAPILVIDGVMTSNMDEMHRMNPKDIESFTVLKDAEAVAIYGSKGGNGAIVITTKRGEVGQFNITYGYSHNFSQPTVLPSKLSSYELATIANEAADNDKQDRPYTDIAVQKYKDQSDPFNYPNTDWQDVTLKNFAQESKHDLSIMGGDKRSQYYASLSYFDQGSLYRFDTNWLKRMTYRMSLTNNFEKIGLKSVLSLYGNLEKTREPYSHYSTGYWYTWGHIQNSSPMGLAYTDLGYYSTKVDHPLVEIDPSAGYNRNDDRNINAQLDLEWNVPKIEGLKLKVMGYFRTDNYFGKYWKKNADQYQLGSETPIPQNLSSLGLESGSGWTYRIQPLVSYEKNIKKHSIETLFGYDETYSHFESVLASRENYILDVDQIFAGPTETAKNNGVQRENANAGFVGRLKYAYDNRYMVEGSIRYDGNDNFPDGKRWGTFYSGSLGWAISEEKLVADLKEKIQMDLFKLRFSYGETGLDDGVERFEYLPGYALNEFAYVVNGVMVPGFKEGNLVSPDITWFERKSVNTGVDFAFMDNRIAGSLDYFFYETVNYLGSPSGASYTDPLGTSLPKVNTDGKHRRAGWEFDVRYQGKTGELNYVIGANLTRFDELWVVKHDESEDQLMNPNTRLTHQTGIGAQGFISQGYYQNAGDVMNSPKRNDSHDLVPGDIKYKDINGDGQIDSEDQIRLGKPSFPRVMYGMTVDLNYKAWSAGLHFQGAGNRHVYLSNVIRNSNVESIKYPFQTDYWTPENTNATYPRVISNEGFNGNNNTVDSDFWLVNSRYFRLKSLQVGYDLKQDLLKSLPFSRCDLFVSGTNLFTISKIFSDYKMDPETDDTNNYGYPLQRVISVGLNVGF
ncbi:TonB-dependent receptor [Maribellus sp. CM-23]|uniref:SusC/RagA family TonB-linked outer membrane protein n=1 Tax=Maribellus sp. CM-23 TaxID=2781026 RepID=UPI001F1CF4E1|nr:TonB-dependent receptor [Maribellus sp. CM-23]MCE4566964.1 TonB-dependent receptor [Maribellus sp. CM-23]